MIMALLIRDEGTGGQNGNSLSAGSPEDSNQQIVAGFCISVPAGSQFRVMMKTLKFKSIMKNDDYDFRSSKYQMLKPQETKGSQFPPIEGKVYPAKKWLSIWIKNKDYDMNCVLFSIFYFVYY